jgi:hypothetical protein
MWQDEHLENASDLSLDSTSNRQKVNDLLGDPRAFKVKRMTPDGFTKKVTLYAAGPFGHTIRNAVSGFKYVGDMVGSKSEDLYFKVKLATGEAGIEGATLFYESPEQYENHQFNKLSQTTKEKWHNKFISAKYVINS